MAVKKYIGYKPYKHQKAVHDFIKEIGPKAGYIIPVKAKRQIGKSFLIEQELLRHSINYPKSVSVCVSITFSNCKKIFKELYNGIKNSGIIAEINKEDMTITLVNGSEIVFKSAMQREQLRGYTVKNGGILCIDEAAYLSDDIFGIISPWVDVYNANILMVSTPRTKDGFFYDYFTEGLKGEGCVKTFDLNDFDTSFLLSPKKLETYRKLMPLAQFTSEYLGCFVDELGGVFDIKRNVWIPFTNSGYNEIFLGIDFGTGKLGDYSAVSGFDASGRQVFLEYTNTLSPSEQIDWIADIILNKLDPKKIKKIFAESNSIGNVYIDLLRKKVESSLGNNVKIEEFTTTNDTKREIIEYLISRIGNESVKLFDDNEQYREFSMYMMEITPSGKVSYNSQLGAHDDCVMASAIALYGIKKLEKTGKYSVSVIRGNSRHNSKIRNKH